MNESESEVRLPVSQTEDIKEAIGDESKDVETQSEVVQCELQELPPLQKLEPLSPVDEEAQALQSNSTLQPSVQPVVNNPQKTFYQGFPMKKVV